MTTIDSFEPARSAQHLFGRLISRLAAILRMIGEEVAYMVREDGAHGRIERGSDDRY
jgi:hypothetical protein